MKQLYLDIKEKLQEVDSIKHIAVWNNQAELIENERAESYTGYTCALPAAFVELTSPAEIQQLGDEQQLYDPLIVRIHIVTEYYHNAGDMEEDLSIFDLRSDVYKKLQKFEPDGAVAFVRTQEEQDQNHTNVYHFIQTYTTNYLEYINLKEETEKEPPTDLEITGEYEDL